MYFSRSTPNIAKVIPAMDLIDKNLATAALDNCYEPSVQAALLVGKKLLNKYYDMTDQLELYRITMSMYLHYLLILSDTVSVLHPSHKLNYFKTAGWEEEWVQTAEDIVRTEFEQAYAVIAEDDDKQDEQVCSKNII